MPTRSLPQTDFPKPPKDLEIPAAPRKGLYRFFEILPGALSYLLIILLFVLSFVSPVLGSVYLLIFIAVILVKAIGTAFRTVQGYKIISQALKVDWAGRLADLADAHSAFERLRGQKSDEYGFGQHLHNLKNVAADPKTYPKPDQIYHAVMMAAYNETLDTIIPSIEAVRDTTFDNQKIIFILAYEARGGEAMRQNAKELKARFKDTFFDFLPVEHPENLKNEIKGKGPNLTFAAGELSKYLRKKHINPESVIVTSLDSDNRMSRPYLDYVAYEFIVNPERQNLSYQPVSIFTNNIWEASAPMRIVAVSNSFFNVITTMRPHALRNFASHSQPFAALEGMNFWSKRTIVEDGHQYWRSLFYFNGRYDVLPIRVPIYQDAVISDTLWETLKAQFIQLRRWDYGASDVAYVGTHLFNKQRKMPFWPLFTKFVRLLDGHVTLAAMSPIVCFGGWVPLIMNLSSHGAVAYNLPGVVATIQTVALIGLIVTVITSIRMLPSRPANYRKTRSVAMVIQWVLMPIVAIIYTSAAAFYSQTRLMFGRYMEKFDVTKKVVKKSAPQK